MIPLPLSTGADWSKAATILGVVAIVANAIKEVFKRDDDVKELKRKVGELEKKVEETEKSDKT